MPTVSIPPVLLWSSNSPKETWILCLQNLTGMSGQCLYLNRSCSHPGKSPLREKEWLHFCASSVLAACGGTTENTDKGFCYLGSRGRALRNYVEIWLSCCIHQQASMELFKSNLLYHCLPLKSKREITAWSQGGFVFVGVFFVIGASLVIQIFKEYFFIFCSCFRACSFKQNTVCTLASI